MELHTIRDAFNRVAKKQKLSSSKTQEVIEEIIGEIEQALEKLKSGDGPALQPIFNELNTKLIEVGQLDQVEDTQKQLNLAMSKYANVLENFLNPDISKAYRNVEFDTNTINQIIARHFYRQGLFDIGDCFVSEGFISEAQERDAASMKSSFLEMYQILSAMRMRNLEPALNWATIDRRKLKEIGSDLELKLHRQQFVEILKKGKDSLNEALKYSRNFLAPLASNHLADIQKLMGCLLWIGRLEFSPYPELLSTSHWDELIEELTQEFCNLLGQSYESPLSVTVAAGVQGLPPLLKLMHYGRKDAGMGINEAVTSAVGFG